ncbi:hypothetical protein V6N11_072620 [Hibiscus sabdariffa]|uniref:Uncharacterized protein n=1 Tax=Hibiscus sabdariffa TaxID=183260 RepID=A0ABR2U3W0_9ROSI
MSHGNGKFINSYNLKHRPSDQLVRQAIRRLQTAHVSITHWRNVTSNFQALSEASPSRFASLQRNNTFLLDFQQNFIFGYFNKTKLNTPILTGAFE